MNTYNNSKQDYQMHKTTCSKCGGVAEVPFKPTGEKPVLCRDCFGKKRGDNNDRRGRRDDHGRGRDFGSDRRSAPSVDFSVVTERIDLLHKKIDKIMKALDIKEPFQTKDVFRAHKEELKPKIPKRAPVEEGALKEAVEKILPKKSEE
jgi:CxxC-x17-CxxC domain-containing protein